MYGTAQVVGVRDQVCDILFDDGAEEIAFFALRLVHMHNSQRPVSDNSSGHATYDLVLTHCLSQSQSPEPRPEREPESEPELDACFLQNTR